jgi:hypothetical protein
VHDTLLFWGVYLAFFAVGSMLLVDPQAETLHLRRRGRLVPALGYRLPFGRRHLVMTNPFDPFDWRVTAPVCPAELQSADYQAERQRSRRLAGACRPLAWLSLATLCVTLLLGVLSIVVGFAQVVMWLLLAHLGAWLAMSAMCVRAWRVLQLESRPWSFIFEALLVPAYVIHAAKRLCAQSVVNVPGLALSLREIRRCRDDAERALWAYGVAQRLDELEFCMGTAADLAVIQRQRSCLSQYPPI